MLDEMPRTAIPLVFRLLGETGAHAPVLNDVVLRAQQAATVGPSRAAAIHGRLLGALGTHRPGRLGAGRRPTDTPRAHREIDTSGRGPPRSRLVAGGRRPHHAVTGAPTCRLDRVQFGRPVASFQAIRHRLAETLVAVEGAEATLVAAAAEPDDLSFLLAKAAAGQAALITAARHCQQVLGGIGFTAEHGAASPCEACVGLGWHARQYYAN